MQKTLLLILTFFISLVLLSLFSTEFTVFSIEIKKPDIYSDLFQSPGLDSTKDNAILNDTSYFSDTTKSFKDYITDFRKDSLMSLGKFNTALRKTEKENKVTRIAFLGDSMIEGDLVAQTVRYKLQKKFGGSGVGFVPITSQTADFRRTIKHKYSSNWNILSILNEQGEKTLGLSGYVFKSFAAGKNSQKSSNYLSWVTYKPVEDVYENLKTFYTIKLYFGKTDPENFVTFNSTKYFLNGNSAFNQIILNDSNSVDKAEIDFHTSSSANIYGVSFESPSGVFVDNYSVRGNSGIPLVSLSRQLLKSIDSIMNYNLIILQYGLNIAEPNTKDMTFYVEKLIPAINHLKECFPNADIMVMSVSDKCYKRGGRYITEPSIPLIIKAQEQIAKETGCVFWNLYEAMGGANSMTVWVRNNFANKDYTHFNYQGAEKVGTFLYNQLMYHYLNYLKAMK